MGAGGAVERQGGAGRPAGRRAVRGGGDDIATADPASLADGVVYLAAQSPRAMTHELQVTPALDQWVP